MRELPRKLSVDELSDLFEGRTRLVEHLAEIEYPLDGADDVLAGLSEEEKVEALAAHPAIGQKTGLSTRSAAEQGTDDDPTVLAELAELSPEIAAQLATETGAPLDWLPTEVLVRGTAHLEQLAGNWIRDNPARAIELARYWLQPASGTNVNQLINGGTTQ